MSAAPTDTPSNPKQTIQEKGKKKATANARVWVCPGDGEVWPMTVPCGRGVDSFTSIDGNQLVLDLVNPTGYGGTELSEVGPDKDKYPVFLVCDAISFEKRLPLNKTVPFCYGPVVLYRMMKNADRVLDLELASAFEVVNNACHARRVKPPSRLEWREASSE